MKVKLNTKQYRMLFDTHLTFSRCSRRHVQGCLGGRGYLIRGMRIVGSLLSVCVDDGRTVDAVQFDFAILRMCRPWCASGQCDQSERAVYACRNVYLTIEYRSINNASRLMCTVILRN